MKEEDSNNELEIDRNSKGDNDTQDTTTDTESEIIAGDKEKLSLCEDKLQRVLADYQNLERRSKNEVSQKVTLKINQIILSFLGIYEDFIRA